MNKIIVILASLLFMVGCEKEVSSLQYKNDLHCEINSEVGFTGKLLEKYPNGQKMHEGRFKDGKREGFHAGWYENGMKQYEGYFKDGKEEGLAAYWYEMV